jgi:hypothetical protein
MTKFKGAIWILETHKQYNKKRFKYSNKQLFEKYKLQLFIHTLKYSEWLYARLCNTKMHTTNSIPNIPSCSTLVTLEAKDVIPVTNYCKAIK